MPIDGRSVELIRLATELGAAMERGDSRLPFLGRCKLPRSAIQVRAHRARTPTYLLGVSYCARARSSVALGMANCCRLRMRLGERWRP